MYPVSQEYLNYIKTSVSRVPKSMLVIDSMPYLGDTIKMTPKISHQATSFVGGFPAKKCTFEIYSKGILANMGTLGQFTHSHLSGFTHDQLKCFNGALTLNGKEVTVFRGLDINGAVEWVPMGLFSATPENIKTNDSGRVITFTGTDRSALFDVRYASALDWEDPHTGLEIVTEICSGLGIALETPDFSFSDYAFSQRPNISAASTCREVISRMAEIGGEIAFISRTGGLVIKKPTATGVRIPRTRYEKLAKEQRFGDINQISLGHKDYEDAILEPFSVSAPILWRIDDNPYIDLVRENIIVDVSKEIFGMSITPFELVGCIDDFYLDINDVIEIEDKSGVYFQTTILQIDSTSRIKSTIKASAQGLKLANVDLAGSKAAKISQVKLEVDHTLNKITASVAEVEENVNQFSSVIEQTAQKILMAIAYDYASKENLSDSEQRASSSLKLTADSLLLNFSDLQAYTENVEGALNQYIREVATWIRFGADGMTMGKVDSPFTSQLNEQMLAFLQSGRVVSYFSNNKQYITDAEITNSLQIGKYAFIPRANGNTSWKWIGQ